MTSDRASLSPHESELVGQCVRSGGGVKADAVSARIEWLTQEVLEPLANDSSGWETLFRDPSDGRLWERTFPDSEMHGGGPAGLRLISEDDAAAKYEQPWGRGAFERRRAGRLATLYLSGQLAFEDFLSSMPDEPLTRRRQRTDRPHRARAEEGRDLRCDRSGARPVHGPNSRACRGLAGSQAGRLSLRWRHILYTACLRAPSCLNHASHGFQLPPVWPTTFAHARHKPT